MTKPLPEHIYVEDQSIKVLSILLSGAQPVECPYCWHMAGINLPEDAGGDHALIVCHKCAAIFYVEFENGRWETSYIVDEDLSKLKPELQEKLKQHQQEIIRKENLWG